MHIIILHKQSVGQLKPSTKQKKKECQVLNLTNQSALPVVVCYNQQQSATDVNQIANISTAAGSFYTHKKWK
jgi:hypothetical protein